MFVSRARSVRSFEALGLFRLCFDYGFMYQRAILARSIVCIRSRNILGLRVMCAICLDAGHDGDSAVKIISTRVISQLPPEVRSWPKPAASPLAAFGILDPHAPEPTRSSDLATLAF